MARPFFIGHFKGGFLHVLTEPLAHSHVVAVVFIATYSMRRCIPTLANESCFAGHQLTLAVAWLSVGYLTLMRCQGSCYGVWGVVKWANHLRHPSQVPFQVCCASNAANLVILQIACTVYFLPVGFLSILLIFQLCCRAE